MNLPPKVTDILYHKPKNELSCIYLRLMAKKGLLSLIVYAENVHKHHNIGVIGFDCGPVENSLMGVHSNC